MKIHVLERALTAACIIAAIAVVWWGCKILAAWLGRHQWVRSRRAELRYQARARCL